MPSTPDLPHVQAALYPIALTNLAGTLAVTIGGGPVGERKIRNLLLADARIRLISPTATAQLKTWAAAGKIEWQRRCYDAADLDGARLVFAATNQRAVNAQIAQDAAMRGLLCNVADAPEEGNFHVPATHRDDGLVIAVSTEAGTPRRAVQVRNQLAACLDGEKRSDAENRR